MFEVVLYNSSRCELDRKQGPDLGALLRELADEGCLGGGDEIHLIDHADDETDDETPRTYSVGLNVPAPGSTRLVTASSAEEAVAIVNRDRPGLATGARRLEREERYWRDAAAYGPPPSWR